MPPDFSHDLLEDNEDLLHHLSSQLPLPTYLDEDPFSPAAVTMPFMDVQQDMLENKLDVGMAELNGISYYGKTWHI